MTLQGTSEAQSSTSSFRLLQIMECMADARTPLRLQDIAKKAEMTQSTVLRYLNTLQSMNYVYQEADTFRYALTWRICALCSNLKTPLSLRNLTAGFLNQLASQFSLGACLVINQDEACFYVDCIDSPNFPTWQKIGKTAPLHTTGSGKVLLSNYAALQLNEYMAKGLERYTETTITDPELLRAEIAKIRERGYAMDEGEYFPGLRCISFPLRDYTGQIVAAISLYGGKTEMPDERIKEELYAAISEAAAMISTRLGNSMQ